ncbi:hypothetical protein U1Q18_052020 [Sarracenia purpurea var. burkii]
MIRTRKTRSSADLADLEMSSKRNPLIFYQTATSLQQIATVNATVLLWQYKIANSNLNTNPLTGTLPAVKSIAQVPLTIENSINESVELMEKSIIEWIEYHYKRIFFPRAGKYAILKYFQEFAWHSIDCTINFKQTAKNLIANTDLDDALKHRLACQYCLEDEVRRLWPTVQIKGSTEWEENYLYTVFYWDQCMNNVFIDPGMFHWTNRTLDNWPALFYFWSILKPEDKVEGANSIILSHMYKSYSKYLLPLMTKTQLKKLFGICDIYALTDLAYSMDNSDYVLQTWNYMKKTVSKESFMYMIKEILNPPVADRVYILPLMYDIWLETPQRLKNVVLKNTDFLYCVLDLWFRALYSVDNLSRDVRWLLELLHHTSSSARSQFWLSNWHNLIFGVSLNNLNELIKLCLGNDQKVANFKKDNLVVFGKIEQYCNLLARGGFVNELDEFLNFCSSDPNIIKDFKRRIVWSFGSLTYCVRSCEDVGKMRVFEAFINEVHPDPVCRQSLKRQMIMSCEMLGYLREGLNCGVLRRVKNLVDLFLTLEEDITLVKNHLRQHCHLIVAGAKFSTFDIEEWNEFLMWSLNGNKKQFEEFKKSIPIDDVFVTMFQKCVIQATQSEDINESDSEDDLDIFDEVFAEVKLFDNFDKLDNFLTWYFVSKPKVKQFKLKMSESMGFRFFRDSDDMPVHRWFFSDDQERIEVMKMFVNLQME